jgi:hypothetical protein
MNITQRKSRKILILPVLFGVLVGGLLFVNYKDDFSEAADLSQFKPGNIMSDYVMTNKNSMTEAQIQNFLNSKVTCDHWGVKPSELGGGTRAQYAQARGWPLPFQCLNTYTQDGETASHIIWQAAQDYDVNPQVLIVLLQKEQSLVTDEWPAPNQYRSATGYGCPDTAACDTQYYGFRNQVRNAAKFFRAYQTSNPAWYKPVWPDNKYTGAWRQFTYDMMWHPNAACGTSSVFIENRATASLYSYTPYRPNQAALDAGYGASSNSCSSYGNRNFYLYFTDWFGNTTTMMNIAHIPNGIYAVSSVMNNDLTLDANGLADGSKVSLWSSNGLEQQKFLFTRTTDDMYVIKDLRSNKALDVVPGSFDLNVWSEHGGCNQKWSILTDGNGYALQSACDGKVLDVTRPAESGSRLTAWNLHGGDNQRWQIERLIDKSISNGVYTISSVLDNSLVLDANGTNNGDAVSLWLNNGGDHQKFQFSRTDDGTYIIKDLRSNRVLDVANDSLKINIWSEHGGCNQRWAVTNSADKYVLQSACSDEALDAIRPADNGSNLTVWDLHGKSHQWWTLKLLYVTP